MEKQNQPTAKDLGELHPKEVDLIWRLRNKYRFGEITIKVRDGIPWSIVKTTVTEHLGLATDGKYPIEP